MLAAEEAEAPDREARPVHELSICQSLLREVRRVADAHQVRGK